MLNSCHAQVNDKKQSLSKSIYTMLFSWLVDKINNSIGLIDRKTIGKRFYSSYF